MTWYDALVVVSPIAGLAAYVIAHITYNCLTGGRKLLIGFMGGFLIGWTAEVMLTTWAIRGGQLQLVDAASLVAVNQFTYLALAYCYINSVNILITSLRIRILHEFLTAEHGLTEEELLQCYSARDLVTTRLARLSSSKQLLCENGRYYSRLSSLLMLAKMCRMLKVLLIR